MSAQKSIIVGIDYSPHSANALREASRIANSCNLPLVCFHILDRDILGNLENMESYTQEGVLNFATEKMDDFIRDVIGTSHEIETVVTIGHPFEETLKLVDIHHAETLVLGSRGFETDENHEVGSLASRCIRKAPVEVLLVRNAQESPFRNIVACVDFSDTASLAVHRAAEIAVQDGANLRLVHVYQPPIYADSEIGWMGPAFPMIQEHELQGNCEGRLEELGYLIGRKYNLHNISTVVKCSQSVHHGIREALEEMDADLVVLGTRGRTGFKALLLGTAAEGLIRHTPCSALAIKPVGFEYSLH